MSKKSTYVINCVTEKRVPLISRIHSLKVRTYLPTNNDKLHIVCITKTLVDCTTYVGGPRILEDFGTLNEGDDELVLVLENQDSVAIFETQGIFSPFIKGQNEHFSLFQNALYSMLGVIRNRD